MSLDQKRYWEIRPADIEAALADGKESFIKTALRFYRKLDDLAYFDDVINKRYSRTIVVPPSKKGASHANDPLSKKKFYRLYEAKGSLPADIALTMIGTGITISEVAMLSEGQLQDDLLYVRKTDVLANQRLIPVHPSFSGSLKSTIAYVSGLRSEGSPYKKIRNSIIEQLKIIDDTYGMKHPNTYQARNTYCDFLLSAGVAPVIINILIGSKNRYHCAMQLNYFHPSEFRLRRSVSEAFAFLAENMADTGKAP